MPGDLVQMGNSIQTGLNQVAAAIKADAEARVQAAKIEAQGRIDAAKVPQRTIALPPTTQERHR